VAIAETRQLFGTDGVRGVANVEPVSVETALRLGRALASACQQKRAGRCTILIGRDTRLSGDMIEAALVAGICSMGGDALLAGVVPTPAVAALTHRLQADAGVVISASHNPFQDNGIKFFASMGFKLSDAAERTIEDLVMGSTIDPVRPIASHIGRARHVADAGERYINFLKQAFSGGARLDGLKIVVDCAHGAAFHVGPRVLQELGAHVVAIGVSPDGENINRGCGAMHPQHLQQTVVAEQAHLGVALDGDADRVIFVDERGEVVDGDETLAMIATAMLNHGTLQQATVVATVMSNIGLEIALRDRGARLVRVQVGDRYVVEEMVRHGYNLGGEQSGHLICLDHSTTGDGLIAALIVLRLMVTLERPLSDLKRAMSKFPQALINVPVTQRRDLRTIAALAETVDRITAALNDRGRVLVRYSGTEPVVRVMVEGEHVAQVNAFAEEIATAIRTHLAA